MRRFGKQPFAWNEKKGIESNVTSEDSHSNDLTDDRAQQTDNITITKETEIQTCRNSVQGRRLIADDQGTQHYQRRHFSCILIPIEFILF